MFFIQKPGIPLPRPEAGSFLFISRHTDTGTVSCNLHNIAVRMVQFQLQMQLHPTFYSLLRSACYSLNPSYTDSRKYSYRFSPLHMLRIRSGLSACILGIHLENTAPVLVYNLLSLLPDILRSVHSMTLGKKFHPYTNAPAPQEDSNLTTASVVNVQGMLCYKALLSPSYRHSIRLPGICRSTNTSIFDTRSYRNGENYRTEFLNTRS